MVSGTECISFVVFVKHGENCIVSIRFCSVCVSLSSLVSTVSLGPIESATSPWDDHLTSTVYTRLYLAVGFIPKMVVQLYAAEMNAKEITKIFKLNYK